jgi:hypothetical protein
LSRLHLLNRAVPGRGDTFVLSLAAEASAGQLVGLEPTMAAGGARPGPPLRAGEKPTGCFGAPRSHTPIWNAARSGRA